MNEKFDGSHRTRLVEEFEKFQAESDKCQVEVITGGRLRWDGNKLGIFGGTVMKMTQGLYRKLYPEKE